MNRSAERIPLRYVVLLSLLVMVIGLTWHAPAPDAAASDSTHTSTSERTSSSPSSSPTPSPKLQSTSPAPSPSPTDPEPDTGEGGQAGDAPADPSTGDSGGGTDDGTSGGTTGPGDGTDSGTEDGGTTDGGTPNDGTTTAPDGSDSDSDSDSGSGSGSGGTSPVPAPEPAPTGEAEPTGPTVDAPPAGTGDMLAPGTAEPADGSDSAAAGTSPDDDGGDSTTDSPGTPAEPSKSAPSRLVLVPGSSKTPSVVAGTETSIELEGIDGGGKYKLDSGELPPGLMLDTKTGKITGTVRQVGKYSFTIKNGSGALQSYTLAVRERKLDIEQPSLQTARAGQPYNAVKLQTEGGGGPFTYNLKGSELNGISTSDTALKTSPLVSASSTAIADVLRGSSKLDDGGPMVQSMADSNDGDAESVTSHVGHLPAGMHLEDGVLTGEPKAHAGGTYTFTVVSTDRYGSTTEEDMTITVLSEGDPVPISAGDDDQLPSSAQLADEVPGEAAAADTGTGSFLLPLMFGILVIGAGAGVIVLRRRLSNGTHR